MKSALCFLVIFLGAVSAIVGSDSDTAVALKPQTIDARSNEHDDDDHDHEHDHEDDHDEDDHEIDDQMNDINGTHDFEDVDYHTIAPEVDASGCQLRLRNEIERKCFVKFEDSVSGSLHIETEAEQEKEVCCALEEYEKCCYRGYKITNCNTDKDDLKETLKAARIFLGAITKNSCSGHRGKCTFSSAGTTRKSSVLLTCFGVMASIFTLVYINSRFGFM